MDRYRVANSTFDDQGRSRGITMAYALQDILGLQKTARAITVGPTVVRDTAVGDDIRYFSRSVIRWPRREDH